jgi:O-methyltransferase
MVRRAHAVGLDTLLDYQRLALLSAAALDSASREGETIEFGSYRGGSAAIIATRLLGTPKTLHIVDSFQGLPAPSKEDNFHAAGDFNDTNADKVRSALAALGLNVNVHVGFFSDVFPSLRDLRFALVHIDADLYSSVMECLEFCYPRMVRDGIMIFDDYAAPTCEGAKLAVDQFFAERPEKVTRLSTPAYGVRIGHSDERVVDDLRRSAGWIAALPFVGRKIFR